VTTFAVSVRGMTCEGCERVVERETARVEGVRDVSASAADDRVLVTGRRDAVGRVCATIDDLGYEVVS
jgi:copper chaperone CopZ